jgi:hypothetical protein
MSGMLDLSHEELYRMRDAPGADQGMLAPAEHRAFAREFTRESPLRAAVSLPFAIPAYTAAKALKLHPSRSPASFAEIGAGYAGLWEGLQELLGGAAGAPGMLNGYAPIPRQRRRAPAAEGGVRG